MKQEFLVDTIISREAENVKILLITDTDTRQLSSKQNKNILSLLPLYHYDGGSGVEPSEINSNQAENGMFLNA